MLFNSIHFAFFLPLIFFVFWLFAKRSLKIQNLVLLGASYFFYACWDWRFLFLLIFSTGLDYYTGIKIAEASKNKKIWLWISILVNLGFLGVLKYYNFFASSMAEGLTILGLNPNLQTLEIILPVGVSFYTFHGLSYVIDIYKNRIEPEKNFVNYSLFVSFFPLLVAGPIERATHLLPQIIKKRDFNYLKAVDGLRQILWGLFKKIVIADNCAEYVNRIFNNAADYHGSTLAIGACFFAFQIYCDFSGYSDIALGTARLFGIELLRNFAFPYFSRDIAEFWRRWHISLSSWFKDYLYIPLGGSKTGSWKKIRNVILIFLASGFWHGANWTFLVWGALNAFFILPSIMFNTNRNNLEIVAKGKYLPTIREFVSMSITFCLSTFAWIFFRAADVTTAFKIISEIFSTSFFSMPEGKAFIGNVHPITMVVILCCFLLFEWLGRENKYAIERTGLNWKSPFRYVFYFSIVIAILWFNGKGEQFVYFQF